MNTDAPRSLTALLTGLTTVTSGDERGVTGIALDSRAVTAGDLFVAVPGDAADGRDHIQQAVAAGAVAVARERVCDGDGDTTVPAFDIVDLKNHIGVIADRFYGAPSARMQLIGVTGSNGKTTCAYLLAQALTHLGRRCALLSTVGTGFVGELQPSALTTADAVATHRALASLFADGADAVCVEVSSHGLQQGRVGGVNFDVALFTNLSRDHLDYHRDMQSYARAKQKLFCVDGLACSVINADDDFGKSLIQAHTAADCITYGDAGDVCARDIKLNENGIAFTVVGDGEVALRSNLIGALNVPNLLATVAALLACGHDLTDAAVAVAHCAPPPGRMELVRGDAAQPAVVIDYAHTPDALARALSSLRELCRGRLSVVFGCGGERDRGKRKLMGEVAADLADRVVVTDDNPRGEPAADITADIVVGVADATVIHDRRAAVNAAVNAAGGDDIVLVAGKGHEATQTVGGRVIQLNDRDLVADALEGKP